MTRRRAFWPGQSGQSVPPGFLGDDDGEQRSGPAVRWRAVDRPLYPDDVEHGAWISTDEGSSTVDESYSSSSSSYDADEPDGSDALEVSDEADGADDLARYDRYGRFDDHYVVEADDLDDAGRYGADGYGADGADGADGYGSDEPSAEGERRLAGLYRFDDLAHPDDPEHAGDVDPTEPLGDVLRGAGVRNDAGSVLRAMLVDRDGDRVEPRPRRGPRRKWRLALAERLVAAWPGQSEESAPPGFPVSGELVLHPPPSGATVLRLPLRGRPSDAVPGLGDDPTGGEAFDDPAGDPGEPEVAAAAVADVRIDGTPGAPRRRFGGSRKGAGERSDRTSSSVPGLPSPRSLQKVAMAVYAALADPIVNADPEARERRTAQVRRLGLLAGSAALAVVLIYAIFPVRTYLEQRAATQRARERIDKLSEANAELEQRKEELRDDETVEEIARRDYQLVFPGEESYGLLPPPVPPTTTTTTPPGG